MNDEARAEEISRHAIADDEEVPKGALSVRKTDQAGRGVFAAKPLQAGMLLNVSHVLLFPADEYQEHGRHTQLDNYTYIWSKGKDGSTMALALGLGSLFNHSYESPNVSYTFDRAKETIRYTLMKNVDAETELCISYGSGKMWWEAKDESQTTREDSAERDWMEGFATISS
ncbi:protein methyltransferase [Meira miltonrushii]|uniref:Protein methyltransferase n=1 Tax=Meira miltonrushii TaxID=1280837 RepID=A0A316VMD2_9BASI|nr:protein methyltransferase [Meira miltonrushii]PWN36725.1 protein methyltransferase [Meira miltonrushii]